MGVKDAEGYLRITGRLTDMIIVDGFNTDPAEIEDFYLRHPAILDVSVVGVPDPVLGEVVMAPSFHSRGPARCRSSSSGRGRSRPTACGGPRSAGVGSSIAPGRIRRHSACGERAVMATRQLRFEGPPGADIARGSIFFIGTATVLVRYAGFTILTDPNFLHRGEHVRLGYGLRSRRLTDPALEIDALPPLDLVVLSHLHEDHWDRVAEARLDRALPVVTTPSAADALTGRGFSAAAPLATWETLACAKGSARLRITSMPGRHGPPVLSRALPEVMGSLLEFETAEGLRLLRIYITGDTLVHDRIREIHARYADIDLALLHLGGTRVLGVLVTMDGPQGVEMMRIVQPRLAIPIHYDDYTVFRSPLSDFQDAVSAARLEDHVHYLRRGDTFAFDAPRGRLSRPA
jgi:L-ascorbate metabolism protein UlaG (beta-lactamase superfamily)